MKAQFKEKTFETAFVGELRLLTNELFAPDQCDEFFLGFDAAAHIPWEFLPPILPFMRRRRWGRLFGITASEIGDFGRRLNDRLPPFRLNVFIQFKRNEYLKTRNASEWLHWDAPYFRYKIEARQQRLMAKIADVAQGRAASVYAAAAFHLSDELFNFQANETVIENSNIASAELLTAHKVFSYNSAGYFGLGHSDPEEIRSPSIEEILEQSRESEGIPFTKHLKVTAEFLNEISTIDKETSQTLDFAKKALLGGEISEIYPRAEGSWFDAIVTIAAFNHAFDIRTCAISP